MARGSIQLSPIPIASRLVLARHLYTVANRAQIQAIVYIHRNKSFEFQKTLVISSHIDRTSLITMADPAGPSLETGVVNKSPFTDSKPAEDVAQPADGITGLCMSFFS